MRSVPIPTVACVALTAALACVLLLAGSWGGRVTDAVGLIVAGAIAFAFGLRTVRASRHAALSVGFVVVFWTLLHCGPHAAVVVAALSGAAAVVFPKSGRPFRPLVGVYAVASLSVTAWVAGYVFIAAGGQPGARDLVGLAVPAAAAAALVSLVAGLTSRVSVWALLREHFAVSALSYYAGAGLAALVYLTWQVAGAWPVIAAAPLLYTLDLALRRSRGVAPAEQA
jgi:hypothetical protein